MRKTIKTWLIIATSLVMFGLVLFVGAMTALHFDFTKLSTVEYETGTYEVNEDFDKISIHADTTEIAFVPSDDEQCRIVSFETEKVRCSASVQNETLMIHFTDTRNKWYDYIGVFLQNPKITVCLPQDEYVSLIIDTDMGDVTIPKDFIFENLEIKGSTADVQCLASVSNVMEIKLNTGAIEVDDLTASEISLTATTGDISVNSVAAKGNIEIETTNGAVTLTNVNCADLTAESDTGTISLNNVVASDSFSIENNTGNVRFENSDASQISVKTSTGDVTGTLRSEKIFITETATGDISVPKTVKGGKCKITTGTGNIKIDIK
ncbi:MAG: DUF4097 family beta strand repeat-containing protein [Acutalibacteraceae bacterium]